MFECVRLAKVLGEFDSVRLQKVRRTSYSGLSVQTPGRVCLRNMERVGIIISKFERLSALLNNVAVEVPFKNSLLLLCGAT